ncbi:bifunctional riboflavin kinase/FAD synthetase [Methylobacillus flagellatus]|uniref:Riboflavin biosynthesis protein n=1 Tax=Methylobacillus flagellatus (strain ATCC 51484 / DSM 6875 / VKM B-1610 / KT) TaxID=265072 RepID=Q1GZ61_METFK|nr:bifunctional riboflavin kinase/FAD synthetase [Methylobacillus flagellatus]ABE50476.1 riboflavin kinase / FMN adenylyltransferase [Methylobacillus flagellatus KT]
MQVFRHFHQAAHHPLAVAIGNFDGVHLGHQALLRRLIEVASAQGLKSAVMTFEPHPREFFAPDKAPARLTSLREKLELFAEAGVDYVYVCHFNRRFAAITVEAFMQDILRNALDARTILVGEDFRFGAGRQGSMEDFARAGFNLQSQPQVNLDGKRVSSTAIREALAKGQLDEAARLLGRPYSISGKVVHGDKLARELGYPTANIHMLHDRPPLFGIYAVKLEGLAEGGDWPGVASLGVRPTVKQDGKPTLEAHLFDFSGDIYGRHVRVKFMHKIRDEMKFDSLETLKYWIARDAEMAREYFRANP